MPIWTHVNTADHLRRRAESLIQQSRKTGNGSQASNSSPMSVRAQHRLEMMDDLRKNSELSAMSGYGLKRR